MTNIYSLIGYLRISVFWRYTKMGVADNWHFSESHKGIYDLLLHVIGDHLKITQD